MPSRMAARSTTAGHAGEILHQDAGGLERHFLGGGGFFQPADDRLGVVDRVAAAVLEAQHVLQQDFQAYRQACEMSPSAFGGLGQREILVVLAIDGRVFRVLRVSCPMAVMVQ